uniref:PAZ domain-containing protein n=1 Tax=Meloidogyne incognita TaxID=6306 RepID=A0A914NQ52_MELIC
MVLIIDECANILYCTVKSLRCYLNHPESKKLILKKLQGRKVETTYTDKNGMKRSFIIGGLSKEGANVIPAYGRLSKPFNISVTQHYYVKHRIRLQNPYLQCIIEQIPNKTESFKENRYYPMELLELVKEDEEKIPNSNEIVKNTEKPANTNNELIILEDDDEDFDQNMLEPSYYCNGW